MKILKIIGISLGALVGIILLVAAFLPSEYNVSRSIEISKSADSVYAVVSDFSVFTRWSPWSEKEPNIKVTITGEKGTVGSSYAWVGTATGQGRLTISSLELGSYINQNLVFLTPFESKSEVSWTFEPSLNGTKTTWSNKGHLDYPLGRFFGLGMEKMLGPDYEHGLANLKKYIESNQ